MPDARVIVIAALLAGPGCLSLDNDSSPPQVSEDVAYSQSGSPCDVDACGNGNSPIIAGVWFWRLSSFGLPTAATPASPQVRLVRAVSSSNVEIVLVADRDRLIGYNKASWDAGVKLTQVEGASLADTKIFVSVGPKDYVIRIDYKANADGNPRTVPFWVPVPGAERVELYRFFYSTVDHDPQNTPIEQPLCKRPVGEPIEGGEKWIDAIAFTGDLYDPVTKNITTTGTDGWMNIACYMGAPYKMHLMGRTTAAGPKLGINTTIDERKSLLNAFTMNACGTGKAFTVQGTRIQLKSHNGLDAASYLPEVEAHEALWGPDGALCLDHHRLAKRPAVDDEQHEAIAAECPTRRLESCDAMWNSWGDATHHGLIRTGNPSWPEVLLIAPP